MRLMGLLAAAAAFWIQPAFGATIFPDTGKDLTLFGPATRLDFTLLDPLPAGTQLTLPQFNEWFTFTKTWTGGGTSNGLSVDKFDFASVQILGQTSTSFSILYVMPTEFNFCATQPAVVGQACSVSHQVWANASWRPIVTLPGGESSDTPLNYTLVSKTVDAPPPVPEPATWALMILGVGMSGIALRKSRAAGDRSPALPAAIRA
ncbi:PEPxxWA-CTERM sorting domain-containing protein [Novosphingobium sp. G106]|uniref:PEPxxWA-CTERM sorting domain-containing protein n=1 Tax=Novosphingobium sp. G106 TaxID=2849500 RepID=UPI001C2CF309|nr:PEPxxWA-CTERM sorting domain-containing protein [Novosphingobium sp. G106]MBV1689568.1 PEPxxWA-CTERM sorting domain-containing protein [Novosphingobium sp. G106]